MFLIPLVLGSLSILFPFISAILLMMYAGKSVTISIQTPLRAMGSFFVVPLGMLLFFATPDSLLPICDSVFGVGIPVLLFLATLARLHRTSSAFAISVLALIIYGMWRGYYFQDLLLSSFSVVMAQAQATLPQYMNTEVMKQSLSMWKILMPAMWTITQICSMFVGLILFHKQVGLSFRWSELRFPVYYNLAILVVLPLYFVSGQELWFINAIASLAVLPILQGVGILVYYLTRLLSNRLILGVSLFIILINLMSYIFIMLLGFADIWLNLRKLEIGGSPA